MSRLDSRYQTIGCQTHRKVADNWLLLVDKNSQEWSGSDEGLLIAAILSVDHVVWSPRPCAIQKNEESWGLLPGNNEQVALLTLSSGRSCVKCATWASIAAQSPHVCAFACLKVLSATKGFIATGVKLHVVSPFACVIFPNAKAAICLGFDGFGTVSTEHEAVVAPARGGGKPHRSTCIAARAAQAARAGEQTSL